MTRLWRPGRGRVTSAAALLGTLLLVAPETVATTDSIETGYASAYAPGVMEGVVRLRFEQDWWRVEPPLHWYKVAGYVAAMDCSRVGEVTTMRVPDGRELPVLIADCAGADGPADRFARLDIIAELDAGLWERLTAAHGTPLEIGLR